MKLSPKNQQKFLMLRTYSHHDHHIDDIDEEFWPLMGVLFTIVGIWTGVIHLLDWLTFDAIPWWAEPFTIAAVIFFIVMKDIFDSLNPLHWWPIFWGYKVNLKEEDRITIRPTDTDRIMTQHGGKLNVHIIDYDTLKFRKRKDAVFFTLTNS